MPQTTSSRRATGSSFCPLLVGLVVILDLQAPPRNLPTRVPKSDHAPAPFSPRAVVNLQFPKPSPRIRLQQSPQRQQSPNQGGYREPRTTALTREDLYAEGRLPPALAPTRPSQRCSLCTGVKSHPVSYLCGHSHCYACIRLWLDLSWLCPVSTCRALITREPHRHFAEEQALAEAFPNWVDTTAVAYCWDGLTFPKVAGDSS
ncbi:hypothetical protein C8F04DRAFT_1282012 [Mycena alexandri]|uniref:RING-type domain-containing protein n=1 Tax=Mycena alexandri TaxID=1745969 RepID=A0AAD6RVZ0_9AGAR|nr:hypothetical protein C8F04DRAFT_1282012 [Mycena alexandri]